MGSPPSVSFRFSTYNLILLTGERVPRLIWVKPTHRNKSDLPWVDEASSHSSAPVFGWIQQAEPMAAPYFGQC